MLKRLALAAGLLLLLSCGSERPVVPRYLAGPVPERLADWGQIGLRGTELVLGEGVMPYALNTPLFTDYAHKLRTIWIPEADTAAADDTALSTGSERGAQYADGDALAFPVGTVISKTFYYPRSAEGALQAAVPTQVVNARQGLRTDQVRLIETRLLVHRPAGWVPLSYVWNEAQTEARYKRTGAILSLALKEAGGTTPTRFHYVVPDENQCAGCHAPNNTTAEIRPLGPSARQLNREYAYAAGSQNQLDALVRRGWLTGLSTTPPRMVAWDDPAAPLEDRARAYLDANCAHCHNPVGPADTSGLHLNHDNNSRPHLGWCKNAIAAGSGTGGRSHDLVPGSAADSILVYRMETRDPAAMMPELGRSLVHREGVALISDWINQTPGDCAPAAPVPRGTSL